MSSLIVSHDLRIIMLEVAVENLFIPWTDALDEALMKKTIIMFRMLDDEWTPLLPNRRDGRSYRGSNYENESFYGGRSVLFSVPEAALEEKVSGVDVQFYVCKEVSKYFELSPRHNFGFTLVTVDNLINGIVKDLDERKELADYMTSSLERAPISRSTRGTYPLLNEDMEKTKATIELYIRITYLGQAIVTEIYAPMSLRKAFYAREETAPEYPYQFRELTTDDLLAYCWGSTTILPPLDREQLQCRCEEYEREKAARLAALAAATQTKRKRRRKKRDDFWDEWARIQALLALLRKMRKGRTPTVGITEKPTKVCPPPPCPSVCPPCPTVCTYSPPCVPCPSPCQPTYSPPMVGCQNNA